MRHYGRIAIDLPNNQLTHSSTKQNFSHYLQLDNMGQNGNELREKVTKINPERTPAHTFSFPVVSKPEIRIGENPQLVEL